MTSCRAGSSQSPVGFWGVGEVVVGAVLNLALPLSQSTWYRSVASGERRPLGRLRRPHYDAKQNIPKRLTDARRNGRRWEIAVCAAGSQSHRRRKERGMWTKADDTLSHVSRPTSTLGLTRPCDPSHRHPLGPSNALACRSTVTAMEASCFFPEIESTSRLLL